MRWQVKVGVADKMGRWVSVERGGGRFVYRYVRFCEETVGIAVWLCGKQVCVDV